MSKSYRLRTQVGSDKNIRININQDFDFLEILSLKLRQGDVYTRFCADYGVVAGRVIVNGGYGIPNATVSIFIPLDQVDEDNPVISTLYPYKTPADKNEDGYRYNLLPYRKSYGGHNPTGTFPDKEDVLTRIEVLEVYEKYYKYTTKTNDSGDFMIVGVPLGIQTIVMDLDLSDMGCFSLRPKDLIRTGQGVAEQFDGENFKSSEDLSSLPQIVNFIRNIDVTPFWGENDICNIGITRTDFDLRDLGIEIKPQAVFMGSLFSTSDEEFLKTNCKPQKNVGKLCNLETGPGKILALRQTINYDSTGRPVLEQYSLPDGGKIIDNDGTWLVELPMNLDYVTTNEFGEQVISNDPSLGIPTKGKYRFRFQYQNENLDGSTMMRADYLVPNIREYGWTSSGRYQDVDTNLQLKSYAFSLDWDDYVDPDAAINCEDYFYEFNFNKVYTVSNFIDRFKWGFNRNRHLGIKEIDSKDCNIINKPPVNDGLRNFDFINFLFNLLLSILTFPLITIIILLHVLAFLWPLLRIILNFIIWLVNLFFDFLCALSYIKIVGWYPFERWRSYCSKPNIEPLPEDNPFKRIPLPMMSFPDCEACPCEDGTIEPDPSPSQNTLNTAVQNTNVSTLADVGYNSNFGYDACGNVPGTPCSDPDARNQEFNQLFSGFIPLDTMDDCVKRLKKLPIAYFYGLQLGFDITLAQSLNLLNVKFSYFANSAINGYPKLGGNIITYKTRNANPTTTMVEESDVIYDQPLILLCDTGTLNQLGVGKLLSFYDPKNNNDPNITGLTTANQFNTNSITGSTPFNQSSLVDRPITFIKPDGTVVTTNIKCLITETEKQYVHSAGVEYFQVITGGTVTDFQSLVTNNNGPLYNYIFNKKQSIAFTTTPLNPNNPYTLNSTSPLSNYNESGGLEILILTRGVDPYTQKQKIKYDLSKLFGYNVNGGNITVEGDYYLNIPIQPNTTPLGNPTWSFDKYTPESHAITNNTNVSLYHEPFGFTVDTTLFTAFTSNNPHFYNSTDKSQSSFKAFPNSPCETRTLGDYTVGGLGYESSSPFDSNPNTMLFEYAEPSSTLIYGPENFESIPTGWATSDTQVWNLNLLTPLDACSGIYAMRYKTFASFAPAWVWTQGVPMTQGKSYRIVFKHKNIGLNNTHKLKIYVGAGQTAAAQTTLLDDFTNMTNNLTCVTKVSSEFICQVSGNYNFGFYGYSDPSNGDLIIDEVEIYESIIPYTTQGRIEGGSFMASNVQSANSFYSDGHKIEIPYTLSKNQPRLYSPAYHTSNPPNITITSNNKLVFRSDRLPTSDKTEILGNSSLSLHLNDNFNIYKISDTGQSQGTAVPSSTTTSTDNTGNLADFAGDAPSATSDVLVSLTCEGMVPLKCYAGGGTQFSVLDPCEDNQMGKQGENKRVGGGCYYFVDNKLIVTIPKDIKFFFEWRARYRIIFAACRGVFSQVFQNNWLNGSLYMFSLKKQTIFNIAGQPKKYKFCGTVDSSFREGQGVVFYTEGTTNSFFYRSSPYNGNSDSFVGQIPESSILGNLSSYNKVIFPAVNDRNLFFPTTIMDLGPRDLYTKEICSNPNFQGYMMKNFESSSYNDTSDLFLLAVLSRMVNSKWWEKVLTLGDSSISAFFSRSGARLDGDITQMYSINSEFGIVPFGDEEYNDDDIYIETNQDSLYGIFFSSDTITRQILSPGAQTFSLTPPLLNYYGYNNTQEVPMYKWKSDPTAGSQTIFGTDKNNWDTDVSNNKLYSQKYQSMSFLYAPTSLYFNTTPTGQKGYIFNSDNNGNNNPSWNGSINTPDSFVVGAPFHFYFGLYKGRTALNKFIKNYIGE